MSSNAKKLLEGDALILKLLCIQLVTLKVVWFTREIASKKKKAESLLFPRYKAGRADRV